MNTFSSDPRRPDGPTDDGPTAGDTEPTDAEPTDAEPTDAEPTDAAVDGNDHDADFAPQPRQRFGASTALLAAVLAIAIGFAAGAEVQRQHSPAPSAAAAGFAAARSGAARGEGGFGAGRGSGQFPGGSASAAPSGAQSSAAALPAVIGTITAYSARASGTALTVTNLGGRRISVVLTKSTIVTAPLGGLKDGQTVAVTGHAAPNGTVTATAVTVQ